MYATLYAVYVLITVLTSVLIMSDPTPPGRHPSAPTLLLPTIAFVFFVVPMSIVNLIVLLIDTYGILIKKTRKATESTFQAVRLFLTPLMIFLIMLVMFVRSRPY